MEAVTDTSLPAREVSATAAHQPTGYIRRLKQRALSRKVSSQIPHDGNKNMPALLAVAPLVKLPHARLKHFVRVKTSILTEQRLKEPPDRADRLGLPDADPLERLVDGVRVGKDVVGSFPIRLR